MGFCLKLWFMFDTIYGWHFFCKSHICIVFISPGTLPMAYQSCIKLLLWRGFYCKAHWPWQFIKYASTKQDMIIFIILWQRISFKYCRSDGTRQTSIWVGLQNPSSVSGNSENVTLICYYRMWHLCCVEVK